VALVFLETPAIRGEQEILELQETPERLVTPGVQAMRGQQGLAEGEEPVYMVSSAASILTIVLGTEGKEGVLAADPEALLIAITPEQMQTLEALETPDLLETPELLETPVHLGIPELLEILET
jgi:hypothetical protein